MNVLFYILYIWQLPQNILGLLFIRYYKAKFHGYISDKRHNCTQMIYTIPDIDWGISLGLYQFVPLGYKQDIINHEFGHCIQSKYLGPLYIIIIGIPSVLAGYLYSKRKLTLKQYMNFPTEKSAEELVKKTNIFTF